MKPILVEIIHPKKVPFYSTFSRYTWVGKYLDFLAKKKELIPLEAERKKIEGTVICKEDFRAKLKEEYQSIKIRREQYLTKWLIGQWATTVPDNTMERYNYMQRGVGMGDNSLPIVPDWDEFEKILEGLEFQDTISKGERTKIFIRIDRQIEKVKKELSDLCPDKYCDRINGHVTTDRRVLFVKHWSDIQRDVNGPCGPIGLMLDFSSKLERKAHQDLGLQKYVNPLARCLPHTGAGIPPSLLGEWHRI